MSVFNGLLESADMVFLRSAMSVSGEYARQPGNGAQSRSLAGRAPSGHDWAKRGRPHAYTISMSGKSSGQALMAPGAPCVHFERTKVAPAF
jgi:hypothetical protein